MYVLIFQYVCACNKTNALDAPIADHKSAGGKSALIHKHTHTHIHTYTHLYTHQTQTIKLQVASLASFTHTHTHIHTYMH